jgi:PAS domain S-box-containing protein
MKNRSGDNSRLRRAAEKRMRSQAGQPKEISVEDARGLIHELRLHQIELEMQNEELRQAHALLEESRTRYADLYDFAPVGYLALDDKGQVLEANLAAATQLGAERARLVGTVFPLYVNPKDRQQARLHIMTVFKTRGRQTCELRLKPKRGEEFYARLESIFIENTNGEGRCRTSISDISNAKRSEQALHRAHDELEERVTERTAELTEANERLRREIANRKQAEVLLQRQAELLHLSYDAVIVWRLRGHIESWNKGAEELYGYSQEEAVGQVTHDLLKTIHPEPWCQIEAKLRERKFWEGQLKHRTREGQEVIVSARHQLVRGADGVERVLEINRDITERKQTEESLREKEAELREAQRIAHVGSWHWDAKTDVTTGSDELLRIYGFDPATQFMPNFRDQKGRCYPDDDWVRLNAAVQTTMETGIGYELDVWAIRGGKPIWVTTRSEVIRNDDGQVVGLRGTVQDISERKQMEEALRASERLYRAIGESIDYGVWVCAPDGKNIYASESFLKLVGITREECSDFGWGDVLHPEDAERTIAAWKECVSTGGTWDIEHRFRGVDGQWRPILARGVAVKDEAGKIVCWAGINLDISARKEIEEELRKSRDELELRVQERTAELVIANEALRGSEQRFRRFYESGLLGVIFWNMDGIITDANDKFLEMIGYDREDLAAGRIDWINMTPQEYRHLDQASVTELKATGVNDAPFEKEYIRKDGSRVPIILAGAMLDETRFNGVAFVLDITAKKLAQEALRSNMARLELVNAELQEFAFAASHDLQEPLRKIQTFCDMAQKRCAPVLDSAGKDYLDRVVNSASRMRQLLSDLLDFSRVATRPEPFKKIELAKIVREAADVFEATVKETGCQIEVENIPAIEADESQMLRLFQNLIGNALKFRSGETPKVKVHGKLVGRKLCEILVEDDGIGFDPQFAELIFKPFQRLHRRNEYDGTGMGLAICRKIVERHGGNIRAESEPGKGSTFIIRLPVKQDRWKGI